MDRRQKGQHKSLALLAAQSSLGGRNEVAACWNAAAGHRQRCQEGLQKSGASCSSG